MSQAKFSAFERIFDGAIALVMITIGAVVATATAFAGA
jgi:hypothetical protein